MNFDTAKLIALAGAAAAGCFASSACWGWRMLAARSIRRPWASGSVYGSLGLCFGLAAALAVDMHWECDWRGKLLSGLASGASVGLFGPDAVMHVLMVLATEWETYQRARAVLRELPRDKLRGSSPPEEPPTTLPK